MRMPKIARWTIIVLIIEVTIGMLLTTTTAGLVTVNQIVIFNGEIAAQSSNNACNFLIALNETDGQYFAQASNGTVCFTSINCTSLVNQANIATNGTGTVEVTAGSYSGLTGSIIPVSGQTLKFDKDAVLFWAAKSNCIGIEIFSKNNITIDGGELDGNKAQQTSSSSSFGLIGVHAWYSTNILVENMNIHDWNTSGIYLGSYDTNCTVEGNAVTNIASGYAGSDQTYPIAVQSYDSGITIRDNIVDSGGSKTGISLQYSVTQCSVYNNQITDSGLRSLSGIMVFGDSWSNNVYNNTIISTYTFQSGEYYYPIEIYHNSSYCRVGNNKITVFNAETGAHPSGLEIDTNSSMNTCQGNIITSYTNNTWAGLVIVDGGCCNNSLSANSVIGWYEGAVVEEASDVGNQFIGNNFSNNILAIGNDAGTNTFWQNNTIN